MRELGVVCRTCFCTFYTSAMNTHSYMPFYFSINFFVSLVYRLVVLLPGAPSVPLREEGSKVQVPDFDLSHGPAQVLVLHGVASVSEEDGGGVWERRAVKVRVRMEVIIIIMEGRNEFQGFMSTVQPLRGY